tara:strand:+ start:10569 stop:11381 length:813 start_codon:yes stop_codon:yes gene_type:complete
MNDYFPELDGNQSIDNGKMGRQLFKGGGGGGTSTTKQEIDPAILPYITYGLDEAKSLYGQGAPEYYPGQTYIDPSSQTTTAMDLTQARALAGNPLVPAAQAQQLSSISGDYLSAGNPYFSGMMAGAARPAIDQFNTAIRDIGSRTAASGRYGSGAMGEMESQASKNLATALTDKASQLAYQNYGQERGFQNQAIANAPTLAAADYQDIGQLASVGKTSEDYARQKLEADIGRFEYGANAPQQQLSNYLSAAYGAPAPVNQTTTQSGGGGK